MCHDDLEQLPVSGKMTEVTTHPVAATVKHSSRPQSTARRVRGTKAVSVIKIEASAATLDLTEIDFSSLTIYKTESKASTSNTSKDGLTIMTQFSMDSMSRDAVSIILSRLHDRVSETAPNLSTLPKELKLHIFSYLNSIDATSIGLAGGIFYLTYVNYRGDTPIRLNTRSEAPSTIDSSWEIIGQNKCNHCSIYRCQLHRHIQGFFPTGYEYCRVRNRFLPLKPIADIEDSSIESSTESKRVGCGRTLANVDRSNGASRPPQAAVPMV